MIGPVQHLERAIEQLEMMRAMTTSGHLYERLAAIHREVCAALALARSPS